MRLMKIAVAVARWVFIFMSYRRLTVNGVRVACRLVRLRLNGYVIRNTLIPERRARARIERACPDVPV